MTVYATSEVQPIIFYVKENMLWSPRYVQRGDPIDRHIVPPPTGTFWGEAGFFRVERGVDALQIETGDCWYTLWPTSCYHAPSEQSYAVLSASRTRHASLIRHLQQASVRAGSVTRATRWNRMSTPANWVDPCTAPSRCQSSCGSNGIPGAGGSWPRPHGRRHAPF